MHARQFEIWWAAPSDTVGRRPVLILSRTSAHAYMSHVLVAEVTSTVRHIPQEVSLGKREGLVGPCVANLDALQTISRRCLEERIGAVSWSRHVEVKRALGHVLHWPEVTSL